MSDLVSFKEFARIMDVSDTMVRKWIAKEKISAESVDYSNKAKPMIYVEEAKADLIRNRRPPHPNDPNYEKYKAPLPVNPVTKKEAKTPKEKQKVMESITPDPTPILENPERDYTFEEYREFSAADITKIKDIKQIMLTDVKIGEAAKRLVSKEAVYAALFATGQEVRDRIMAVPDRIVDDCMLAKNRDELYQIIAVELHSALTALANADRHIEKL